jgi:hypothetical protein
MSDLYQLLVNSMWWPASRITMVRQGNFMSVFFRIWLMTSNAGTYCPTSRQHNKQYPVMADACH